MADKKISQLTSINGVNVVDLDEFALVDTSATETKRITFQEFKTIIATLTTTQTLSNKTLSSPVINTPDITWDTNLVIGIPSFEALTSSRSSTDTVDIDATYVILFDNVNFKTRKFDAVNLTINAATSGANGLDTGSYAANTWYANFIIGKPDNTVAGLHSLSFTAPTMPAGFLFKKLVGVTRCLTIGPVVFREYKQNDRGVISLVVTLGTGLKSAGVLASLDISVFIPPSFIKAIDVTVLVTNGVQTADVFISGSDVGPSTNGFNIGSVGTSESTERYPISNLTITTSQTMFHSSNSNPTSYNIFGQQFELNI